MNSQQAYFVNIQEFDEEFDQLNYGVVALPVPLLVQRCEKQQLTSVDGPYSEFVPGLTQGTKASKFSPIVMQQACGEQSYASLVKQLSVVRNGLVITHTDQVDFQEDKKKYVVVFSPEKQEFKGDEIYAGVKDFVQKIKTVIQ